MLPVPRVLQLLALQWQQARWMPTHRDWAQRMGWVLVWACMR